MKGNYSEFDRTNWTPELKKALNYDQMQALQVDNGNNVAIIIIINIIQYFKLCVCFFFVFTFQVLHILFTTELTASV